MPFTPTSVAVLTCENVLREQDDVLTAIRIVDVFQVPEAQPDGTRLTVRVIIVIRAYPSDETYTLALQHEYPRGTFTDIQSPQEFRLNRHRLEPNPEHPIIPTGLNIRLDAHIDVRQFGTHVIRALVDGNEITRTQFTLLSRAQAV